MFAKEMADVQVKQADDEHQRLQLMYERRSISESDYRKCCFALEGGAKAQQKLFIAIAAVILVIIIMLPLRIAVVAAMAIPMTIALTLGVMNMAGIELQQVSLAALIVVLGLVVDDAIVVADNYVEQLDQGETRWNAAWKSASELVVPILVATLTIIFAFLPMLILTGAIGEFIESLPLTVSIALSSSFVVAMFFTPILCYTFVKKGLHDEGKGREGNSPSNKRPSFLDKIQLSYNRALDWCVSHRRTTIIMGMVPMALPLAIYMFGIRQKFFPSAERNQFVMDLWMPCPSRCWLRHAHR